MLRCVHLKEFNLMDGLMDKQVKYTTPVCTITCSYLREAHLHAAGLAVGVQVIWLIYWVLPWQCLPLLTLQGWGWPLTVNTPGWKPSPWWWCGPPASTRGQLGPHILPCQPPLWFHGRSWCRSGLSWCPSGADPRSVTGLRPEVSLAPGPIKNPWKRASGGEVMGCNCLSVWEDIITGTGQTQPDYKELYK